MTETIKIGGELESMATGGVVAAASAIKDKVKNKYQGEINAETDATLTNHASAIQGLNSQNYVTATATDQTTAVTDVLPATGSADTVYRVGNWDGTQFDETCYSEYSWNGSAYVHISTKTQIGEVFDISAYHASGGTLAKYTDLSDALGTNGANIPESLRKGGMSVKFVLTSDNKYVQYRFLLSGSFSLAQFISTGNWQNVNDTIKKQITVFDAVFTNNSISFGENGEITIQSNNGGSTISISCKNTTYTFTSSYIRLVLHHDNTIELLNYASAVEPLDIVLLGYSVSADSFTYGALVSSYLSLRGNIVEKNIKKQITIYDGTYSNNGLSFGNYGKILVQDINGGAVVNINVSNETYTFSSSYTRLVLHIDNTIELVAYASDVLSTDIVLLGWSASAGDFGWGELYADYLNKTKATISAIADTRSLIRKQISTSRAIYTNNSLSFDSNGTIFIQSNDGGTVLNIDLSNTTFEFSSSNTRLVLHSNNTVELVANAAAVLATDIVLLGWSASAGDFCWGELYADYLNKTKATKKTVKILCIGNSYAFDAMSYVPFLLETINKDVNVIIGIAKYNSCTLQQHYDFAVNNTATYTYCKYKKSESNSWIGTDNTNDKTLISCLQDEEWDIVTFQQQSSNARNYSTYQPYLNNLINWVQTNVNKFVSLSWLLTPAYPTGYSGLDGDTSDEMFGKIVSASQSVLNETLIDDIIPIGTAVQNARKTSLDSLGNFGHLSYDGLHLQEGVPCLLEAYVVIKYILDKCGCEYNQFFGDKTLPTEVWLSDKNIPGKHGVSVGATSENVKIAQQCSIWAIKKPYEIHNLI